MPGVPAFGGPPATTWRRARRLVVVLLAVLAGALGGTALAEEAAGSSRADAADRGQPGDDGLGEGFAGAAPGACAIKGNINWEGERIYHVPGSRWYDRTRIDTGDGERWFCSEAEARAAGWRAPLN